MTAPASSLDSAAVPFPKAMISMSAEVRSRFEAWLSDEVERLRSSHQEKLDQWADEEVAYRALPEPPKEVPFIGACNEVIPVIAMSVDPIHARLDASIFPKNDNIVQIKAQDKRLEPRREALSRFIEYYLRHYNEFRRVALPRLLEEAKHGTCVFRVEYEDDVRKIQTYERNDNEWQQVTKELVKCRGPKITGVPLQNFVFPPRYQHLQDAPICYERTWMTEAEVRMEEIRGRIVDGTKLSGSDTGERTIVDAAQEDSAQHHEVRRTQGEFEVFRFCCHFDINDDGYPESLIGLWHHDSQTLMQLRYNWYFHQRYPYIVIPYSVAVGSLFGIGLCEMGLPFQRSITTWHQNLWNNGYLANCRIIARKRDSVTDEKQFQLYAGKDYICDDPDKDLRVFALSDTYQSGYAMLQTLMGYVEKRTGVSDYLTGRESPIVGSRATATSTVALIQEGTKRVEETLENNRAGIAEIVRMCLYIWIQYGTHGLEDVIFDVETAGQIKSFFDNATELDVEAGLSIDLSATDASNNRLVQQQAQLAVIQAMMMFYERLLKAGQMAIQASSMGLQPLAQLTGSTMEAANKLYQDLLVKYDIRNPETILPQLTEFLTAIGATSSPSAAGGGPGESGGPPTQPGLGDLTGAFAGAASRIAPASGDSTGTNGSVQSYA